VAVHAVDPLDGRPAPGVEALGGLAGPAALVVAPRAEVLWVAEADAGAIATLSIGTSGTLTRVARTAAGSAPADLALSPDNAFLFAASAGTGEVASLAIGANGRLAPARVRTLPGAPSALAAAETGAVDHLLAAGAGGLSLLRIDPATGALEPLGAPLPSGARPRDVAFDPGSSQAFVSDEAGGQLLRFALDARGGVLTPLPPLALGGAPGALAVASGLPFLLVADAEASEILLVEIGRDGALAPRGALRTRLAPRTLVLGPPGAPVVIASEHAYFADSSAARIHQFAVDLEPALPLLDLVPLTPPFALTLAGPRDLALHPDRALVLSADGPGLAVESFARDPLLGALEPLVDEHEEGFASDVEIEPSGRFAFATLSSIRVVRSYALGRLGEILPLADFPAGTYPERMALDPAGRTLYVTDEAADRLLAFALELGGGALAPVADVPAGGGPADVALHPSGRYAYVPNALASSLSIYFLEPLAGAPLPLAVVPTAPLPVRAAVHPDGRSLYLLHDGVKQLAHWALDPETGLVEPRASVETLSQPLALAVDPTGAYLVVTNSLGQSVHYVLGAQGEPLFAGTDSVGAAPRDVLLPPSVR
jgi:6-phosphogluconolactonase (cycloisomerase 2 family)